MKFLCVAMLLGTLVGGCQIAPSAPRGETFMITLPVDRFAADAWPGSGRGYYREERWRGSLRTLQLVRRLARDYELQQVDAWPIRELGVHCVLFDAPLGVDLAGLFSELERDERITAVQPNHEFDPMTIHAQAYDDPLFDLQYGEHAASLQQLHEISLGEHSVVGIVDTGVDVDHPDLAGRISQHHELTESGGTSDRLHGTAMAGIIGATADNGLGVVGIAPAAMLYSYGACRQLGERVVCRSFDIAKSVVQAIENRVDVLNISLAGPDDALLEQLLRSAAEHHGMIVVAARNSRDSSRNFPAKLKFVHAPPAEEQLWFARDAQMSTQAGGGYQVFYGSSVSSAAVSGVAALLRSKSTSNTTNDLLHELLTTGCDGGRTRRLTRQLEFTGLCK